ncbi:hypothetical protein ACFL35_11010 [Candidatus Riflebacteria bacterium]
MRNKKIKKVNYSLSWPEKWRKRVETLKRRNLLNKFWQEKVASHLSSPTELVFFKNRVVTIAIEPPDTAEQFQIDEEYFLEIFGRSENPIIHSVKAIKFKNVNEFKDKKGRNIGKKIKDCRPMVCFQTSNTDVPFKVENPCYEKVARIYKLSAKIREYYFSHGYKFCVKCHTFYKETYCTFCYNR